MLDYPSIYASGRNYCFFIFLIFAKMIALLMNEVNFERRISLLEPEIFRTVCYKVIKFFHKYPGIFISKRFFNNERNYRELPKMSSTCMFET